MNIAFYNPYLDAMGGGERYTLTLAAHWSHKHSVSLLWDDNRIGDLAENRFGLDLKNTKVVHNFYRSKNILEKAYKSHQYDLIFFLTDGSIPTSLAKYNILHFQIPFDHIAINRLKFSRFQAVVCNSEFTKEHLYEPVRKISQVIYPPVDIDQFHPTKKTDLILTVGRFTTGINVKNQDLMIEIFKKGYDKGYFKQYKFILVGNTLPADREFVHSLENQIHGYPIQIAVNCSFEQLVFYYAKAKIYWHAAGFGQSDPKLMEHFGITTVESMASGCVPVVFAGGGLIEIVEHGKEGLLWKTKQQLLDETVKLLQDPSYFQLLQKNALLKVKDFSRERFNNKFDQLLHSMCKT